MSCSTADNTIGDKFEVADNEGLLEELQLHAFLTRNNEGVNLNQKLNNEYCWLHLSNNHSIC